MALDSLKAYDKKITTKIKLLKNSQALVKHFALKPNSFGTKRQIHFKKL